MNKIDHEKRLERFVDQVLREQPLLSAPASLHDTVLAKIARQEAGAGWQRGFQAWPALARLGFALASLALIAFAIELPAWLSSTIDLDTPVGISRGLALLHALKTIGSSLSSGIPTLWVYAILSSIAALYAVCFGVGAAAYRALVPAR
jgi:hypothetical protein